MAARATVIIPTYGDAPFAKWAIKSVQRQTVADIEICVICDGSPAEMVSQFKQMAADDERIRVFEHPKSPRTGEPYRDIAIGRTTGEIICYCSHDDLWLDFHVEAVARKLRRCSFTASAAALVNLPENVAGGEAVLSNVFWIDLRDAEVVRQMNEGRNFFGLTYGAHTRRAYMGLDERWVTTPDAGCPTDLYMWRKFLRAYGDSCGTTAHVTALNFDKARRKDRSGGQRERELAEYFEKIQDSAFVRRLERLAATFRPVGQVRYHRLKFYVGRKLRKRILRAERMGRGASD